MAQPVRDSEYWKRYFMAPPPQAATPKPKRDSEYWKNEFLRVPAAAPVEPKPLADKPAAPETTALSAPYRFAVGLAKSPIHLVRDTWNTFLKPDAPLGVQNIGRAVARAITDPRASAENVSKFLQPVLQFVRTGSAEDVSKYSGQLGEGIARQLVEAYQRDPAGTLGRAAGEIVLALRPSLFLKPLELISAARGGRGAAAAAAVPDVTRTAVAAAPRGAGLRAVVAKAAEEEAASRGAVTRALKPGPTKLIAKPGKPVLRVPVPVPTPVAKPVVEVAPGIAPAPVKAVAPQAAGVEEALVARLVKTGLTREEAVAVMQSPEEVQRVLGAAEPVAKVPVVKKGVTVAKPAAPSVEEPLIRRLMATGLSRNESITIIRREPHRVQEILVRAKRPVPEAPAEISQVAPEPLQAVPPGPPAAAPSMAPAPVPEVTGALRVLAAEVPAAAVPIKVPLPTRAAGPPAEVLAEEQRRVSEVAQKIRAREAAKKAAAKAEAVPPVAPEVAPVVGRGIEMRPEVSSLVKSWGYNPDTQEFAVHLARELNPRIFQNVASEVADEFAAAASKGEAFNRLFRGRPEFQMATSALAEKNLADTVESLLASGETEKMIIKGIRVKAKEAGLNPTEFVAKVKIDRGIPDDFSDRVAWARKWKASRRAAIAEKEAVELAPLSPEEVAAQRAAAAEVGGPDFVLPPMEGGSEIQRLKFWHSLEEMGERVFSGLGDTLVRIRTVKELTFEEIRDRLSRAGFTKVNPRGPEDRNLYEAFLGRESAGTKAVAQAVAEVKAVQDRLGDRSFGGFFRIMRTAVDPETVRKMSVPDLANLWVRQGVDGNLAIREAEKLKKLADAGAGLSSYFRGKEFLIPPYEIMRPMRQVVPLYLERASMKVGINETFGSEAVMRRTVAMLAEKHPDYRYLNEMLDQFLGYNRPIGETVRQLRDVGRLANAVSVLVLSPITAVKQLSQVAISSMNLPFQDAVYGFGKMMTTAGWRGAKARAALLTDSRELSGMLLSSLEDATKAGRWAEIVSERVGAPFIKYTGIKAVDNFARGFAYWARHHELDRLVASHLAGNAGATRRLAKAGVDLKAASLSDEIKMVAKEFADRYNLRSDILSSPAYLSQPAYQVMRGLQMFAVNMTKLFYKELIHPTMRPENFRAFLEQMLKYARFAGYGTLVGAMVNRTENFMKSRPQPQSVAAELAGALAALGALGVWDRTMTGLVDKNGEILPLEEWPANVAKQVAQVGTSLFVGAGPGIVFGVPQRLLSKPASLVPGIGPIWQGIIEANK